MASTDESVLKTALPPATDYLTYLTILEYNLEKADLPLLHDILQDEKLVVNIGWDLVQILLPLLPESKDCLEDVAIRGNPREVILKVTEELDRLALPADAEDDDSEADDEIGSRPVHQRAQRNTQSFQSLLHMLCILHSRIQTKKPSRFLEASVSAIVSACKRIASSEDATRASLMFLRAMSGSSRPSLPPRGGEVPVPSVPKHSGLPDPEGDNDVKAEGEEEAKMRLLRILITHVIESYLDSAGQRDPASPMHWTEKFMQSAHADMLPSHRTDQTKSLETKDLSTRETLVRQILDLATMELNMTWSSLKDALEKEDESAPGDDETEEPLTLSKRGALYLITALKARSSTMSKGQDQHNLTFPDHDRIATAIVGDPQVSLDTNIPPATADALVRLGWSVADDNGFGFDTEPGKEDAYNMYLQKFSALAATQVSPELRYHIYLFTNHILKANPWSQARWSFLRDTYRFCPFTSLKEVAVIWVKDEYVRIAEMLNEQKNVSTDIFAQLQTLREMLSDLYILDGGFTSDLLAAEEPFFQACLSLLYFLCSSDALRSHLNIAQAMQDAEVYKYVSKLESTILESLSTTTSDGAEPSDLLGLNLLRLNLAMAQEGLDLVQNKGKQATT